ncbi:MAG: glycoside hydrolase family 125 protein [Bacillota bacterium]|jgi:meiotically up-regulated gene 157 (Mug157) protein|nr:glycoside hydrolase family 125 protein [Bacillota bacterium]
MKAPFRLTRGELLARVDQEFGGESEIAKVFRNTFSDTLENTVEELPDGSVFVVTGDIPAMWLRDSAAQFRPYLVLKDGRIEEIIRGIIKRQFFYINHDPYANAFNREENGRGHQDDLTEMTPLIWERKYEIDSLCYPVQLAYLFWKATGRTDCFDAGYARAVDRILDLWKTEQNHASDSPYTFQRRDCVPSDTLPNGGKGTPVGYTGMTWSGFRPSDDAAKYGYLVPANMFAAVVLGYVEEIAVKVTKHLPQAEKAAELAREIRAGIEQYGKVEHPEFGLVYAYETDGLGNYNFMDDANVPSLLSTPYLGYLPADDEVYLNTRALILSSANPYYYSGRKARGIGSPHTPENYVWHIALAMQGLTSTDRREKREMLELMANTHGGTGLMHEGFHVDDPARYTREWFSWANSMFCELVLDYLGLSLR